MPLYIFAYVLDKPFVYTQVLDDNAPTPDKFSYTMLNYPLFFTVPIQEERLIFNTRYLSIIRICFKIIRRNRDIIHTDMFIHPSGICITFGEMFILHLRRDTVSLLVPV